MKPVSHLYSFRHVFYQNVITLRSGLCYRKSACMSSSCNVGAPYTGGWSFRQYFFTAVYIGHPLTSVQIFTLISTVHRDHPRATPPSGPLNAQGEANTAILELSKATSYKSSSAGDQIPEREVTYHLILWLLIFYWATTHLYFRNIF